MTLDELNQEKATYELYGASMLSRETMEFLFAKTELQVVAETAAGAVMAAGAETEAAKPARKKKGE